jgi:carboxyl-terminal processing protease
MTRVESKSRNRSSGRRAGVVAAAAWLMLASAGPVDAQSAADPGPVPLAEAQQTPEVPVDEIETFAAVWRTIEDAYVDPVDQRRLMGGAVRGLLQALDPHSAYIERSELAEFDARTYGEYAGLGVEVFHMAGELTVIAPLEGSPAARAGLLPGDVIVSIDGGSVPVHDPVAAVEMLRGEAGSVAVLEVLREAAPELLVFRVAREPVRIRSARADWLEPGHARLRIAEFHTGTAAEVRERLRALARDAGGAPVGLVLDLRGNPGGVVDAAVATADAFLDAGVIVHTRGRIEGMTSVASASPGDLLDGAPIVVLVDRGSASAAEIVAGALRDHRRALVVGQRTFGKGSIQSVFDLDNGDAIQITTGRYYSPSGASIQASGITPDIELADLALAAPDSAASFAEVERDLPGHLVAESGQAEADAEAGERHPDLDADYALDQALTALKAMVIAARGSTPR